MSTLERYKEQILWVIRIFQLALAGFCSIMLVNSLNTLNKVNERSLQQDIEIIHLKSDTKRISDNIDYQINNANIVHFNINNRIDKVDDKAENIRDYVMEHLK